MMIEAHLNWLIGHYGYIGIFGALSLGIIGLPIPDETLLAYAGFSVYQGTLNLPLVLLSAFLGSATGITLSYGIGYKLGLPFLRKFGPKFHSTEAKIEKTHRLFERFGKALLLIGYFIPGIRHLTAYIAAISRMDIRVFMLAGYTGALIWSATFITLGYQLGERWFLIEHYLKRYGIYVLILFLIVAVGLVLFLKRRKKEGT